MKKLVPLAFALIILSGFVSAECGNGLCETGENFENCQLDCTSENKSELLVIMPIEGESFLHGDIITIKASVLSETKKILDLDYVKAYGFFGSISLYDDGENNDEKWKDGIFANSFKVEKNQIPGRFSVFISAKQGESYLLKKITIEINPRLSAEIKTEKDVYYLGDEIIFEGYIKRHGVPIKKDFNITVFDDEKKESTVKAQTDDSGNFFAAMHTSFIAAPGYWRANFETYDDLNNIAIAEAMFQVKKPEEKSALKIELVEEPMLFYKRGNDLLLLARVFDDQGSEIFDVNLELETPLGTKTSFEKSDSNLFFAAMKVPVTMPLGKQGFSIHASSFANGELKSGDLNVTLNIKKIGIKTELLSPNSSQAMIGDTVLFGVRMYYDNGEPLTEKIVPAEVNSEPLNLEYKEPGTYYAEYLVKPGDSSIEFIVDFEDKAQNSASFGTNINVTGVSLMHYWREYQCYFLGILTACLIGLVAARHQIKKYLEKKHLAKECAKLDFLLAKTDDDFVAGTITRPEFNRLSAKYSAELASAKNRLQTMEAKKNA